MAGSRAKGRAAGRMDSRPELVAFGARVRELRVEFGVTQRWLGREIGMTSGGLTFLEAGRACPSAEHVERIADVFGLTMDELWRGIGRCEPERRHRHARGRT